MSTDVRVAILSDGIVTILSVTTYGRVAILSVSTDVIVAIISDERVTILYVTT